MSFRVRRAGIVIFAVAVLMLVPKVSHAGTHDHQGGFFLRLSPGLGAAKTQRESLLGTLKMSGTCNDINIAIGGIIYPNLALHATLFGWLVDDPKLEVARASHVTTRDLNLSAFGGGLTYYIMPLNLYISGSLGSGTLSLEEPGGEGETNSGPVFDLTIGKEWWVSSRWGLGAAASFGYHSIPEKGADDNWSGTSFVLRFSATMN